MNTRITDAKIAVLDMNFQKERMKEVGVQISRSTTRSSWSRSRLAEAGMVLERVDMILKADAENIVLTTKAIDDLVLKALVERGAMGVRRCKKEDLRRIARATGATMLSTLSDLNGDEKFDPSYLGYAEQYGLLTYWFGSVLLSGRRTSSVVGRVHSVQARGGVLVLASRARCAIRNGRGTCPRPRCAC